MLTLLAQAAAPTETRGVLRFLGAPEAWVIVLVIVPLVGLGVWWIYRREGGHTSPRSRFTLGSLRAAILLAVIAILFQPVCMTTTHRVIKPRLALLIDDSSSMQERDGYVNAAARQALAAAANLDDPARVGTQTRSELVRRVLGEGSPSLLERLRRRFDVRLYAFASGVRRHVALDDLRSQGTSTRAGDALDTVYTEQVGHPTAAVVLVSDGRSNEGTDPGLAVVRLLEMQQIQIPLYAVGVGDPTARRDLVVRVVKPTPGQEFLVGDQIPFTIEVQAIGFEKRELPVRIEILDEEDQLLAAQPLALSGTGDAKKEVVYVAAEREGRRTFKVRVPPAAGETDPTNNLREVALHIIKKRIKVLYAEGYPRWEYRYLKNALIRDQETYAVHVLLLSAERDFIQEASEDLEPIYAFPTKVQDLFAYDVVILGDVNPANLADTQAEVSAALQALGRFVSEGGGGLLMIAGEGWNPHAYAGTPLAAALPVVPGHRGGEALDFQRPFHPVRTAAGRHARVLVFDKDPAENLRLWEDPESGLPPLYWYAVVERAKPGARVLLAHPTNRNRFGPHPLLVTQYYGKGRAMFLGVDSLWRWRKFFGDQYFFQFYTQALRYLATTKLYRGNKRYDLFTDKRRYDIGDTIRIRAAVRDENFLPAKQETQTVHWEAPRAARPEEIGLKRIKDGEYEGVIMAAQRGRHNLWIKEHPDDPRPADEYAFDVDITPLEKAEPAMDVDTMKSLADLAGTLGRYLPLQELPATLDRLEAPRGREPVKTSTRDVWDRWWVLCIVAALLTVEWVSRRRLRLV